MFYCGRLSAGPYKELCFLYHATEPVVIVALPLFVGPVMTTVISVVCWTILCNVLGPAHVDLG